MSKNIIIQEGGTGKQLTAAKLKTALVGGGSCLWVPEDETQLTTLYASEDGTYTAEAEGYYGFSEVTVSGCGACVGYDSDGHVAMATRDPQTGNIVVSKLPTSIRITTQPAKLEYTDGEAIDLTWIVVKAYTDSGALWTDENHPNGVIPISELIPNPANADLSQVHNASYSSSANTGNVSQPIVASNSLDYRLGSGPSYTKGHVWIEGTGTFVAYGNSYYALAASSVSGGSMLFQVYTDEHDVPWSEDSYSATRAYTYDGRTVYYCSFGAYLPDTYSGIVTPASGGDPFVYLDAVAWTLVYGAMTPGSGQQEIAVGWHRPGDLQLLSDVFYITVTPTTNAQSGASMGEATGGGGYTVGGGAGRN